jgi:hypothetical protein
MKHSSCYEAALMAARQDNMPFWGRLSPGKDGKVAVTGADFALSGKSVNPVKPSD